MPIANNVTNVGVRFWRVVGLSHPTLLDGSRFGEVETHFHPLSHRICAQISIVSISYSLPVDVPSWVELPSSYGRFNRLKKRCGVGARQVNARQTWLHINSAPGFIDGEGNVGGEMPCSGCQGFLRVLRNR